MNILILSDFNIGGQPTALMRAINKYSNHTARCIIVYDDHMAYDYDIIFGRDLSRRKEAMKEASELANNWAEFYHFCSYVFSWEGVDFNKLLRPNNCCIKHYGSYLRDNGVTCRTWCRDTRIIPITGNDFTITSQLDFSLYHLNSYFLEYGDMPMQDIPKCEEWVMGKPLRIAASSGGSPTKGYDVLVHTVNNLIEKGWDVDIDLMQGISHKECLQRKLKCHVTFGSLCGGWGLSGIESMYIGHPVLTCLDPFVLSMYPQQPAILVDQASLEGGIKGLFNTSKWKEISDRSRQFAYINFRTRDIVYKYLYSVDLIRGWEKYKKGGCLPEYIY